jgi:hypothetical protein
MMRRMPCKVHVDREQQEVILDLDAIARRQIGGFLVALQQDPLPEDRQDLARKTSVPAYFVQLPCGFHVTWEIVGDMLSLALTGKTTGLLVRILGVDRDAPR